ALEPDPAPPAPLPFPEPPASAAEEPAAATVAALPTEDPVPAAPAAVPTPAVESNGGFLVQLSAVRSREQAQATYAGLQRSYPSVLGDLEPVIVEADLGERGIYYRVRVGPWE